MRSKQIAPQCLTLSYWNHAKPVNKLVLYNDRVTPCAHGNAVPTQCNYLGLGLSVVSSRVKKLFLR